MRMAVDAETSALDRCAAFAGLCRAGIDLGKQIGPVVGLLAAVLLAGAGLVNHPRWWRPGVPVRWCSRSR